MKHGILAGALALSVAAGGALAQEAATPWIHVRVEEASGTKVNVNLPLPVVQAALALAPERIVEKHQIRLHHGHKLKVSDLRKMWTELRAAGDAELVSIEDEDKTVTVRRIEDRIEVRVDEPGEGDEAGEQVKVDVPVALVDALLSGEGEEVDIAGAMSELAKMRGEIVTVTDKDDTVRVWIDEKN